MFSWVDGAVGAKLTVTNEHCSLGLAASIVDALCRCLGLVIAGYESVHSVLIGNVSCPVTLLDIYATVAIVRHSMPSNQHILMHLG